MAEWFEGLEPEVTGYVQNKGWATAEGPKAMLEAYRNLEKHIGAPPEQLLRLPKEGEIPAEVWQRLGAPAEASGYELPEGTPDWFKAQVASAHVPAHMARQLAETMANTAAAEAKAKAEAETLELAAAKARLDKSWGANKPLNEILVKNAAAASGFTQEDIAALAPLGYEKVTNMFLNLGQRLQEPGFVGGGTAADGGPMSVEMAMSKRAELMGDPAWVGRYLKGGTDSPEGREMTRLLEYISNHGADVRRK